MINITLLDKIMVAQELNSATCRRRSAAFVSPWHAFAAIGNCRSLLLAALVVCFPFVTFHHVWEPCVAAEKRPYLGQTYVDTTIMRAVYNLSEAAGMAGVGFRQKESLNDAKRIARQLRQTAKGDPNEKYVLWKVNELEAQIYLEEKDLLLQKVNQNILGVNQLIARFNGEVGKPRPDFGALKRTHSQTCDLDPVKANNMANSFNKRYRAISREVIFSIEKALMSGDLSKASEELHYCIRNRSFLTIPDSKLQQLESRVDGLALARIEKPLIETELKTAENYLAGRKLSEMRKSIDAARNRFYAIKKFLPQTESGALTWNIDKAQRALGRCEDSLVQVNLTILQSSGVQDANVYLQKTLRRMGVDAQKTAFVDKAILGVSSPDDGRMHQEIDDVAEQSDVDGKLFVDDMMTLARKKAQQKADSVRAIEETRMRTFAAEKSKQDSLKVVRQMIAEHELRRSQDKATGISVQIYSFLEKDNIKAGERLFNEHHPFLKQYLWKDAFDMLTTALKQSTPEPAGAGLAYVPVPQNAPVRTSPTAVAVAPMKPDEKLRKNQERAQGIIIELYQMLERNDIISAYKRFQKVRNPLKAYIDKDAFDILEATIVQAYEYASKH